MAKTSNAQKQQNSQSSDTSLTSGFKLFAPSWNAVRLNLVTLIELIVIPVMVSLLLSVLGRSHRSGINALAPLSDIVALVFAPGLVITQLKSARGEAIDLSQALKEGLHFFWRYVGLAICLAVLIVGGFILFIVPGVIMLRRYFLAPYYLIDKDLKVFEAMRMSANDTKPVSGAVWALIGVTILFGLLSLLLVGIVLSVMYYCAPALLYLQIAKANKSSSKAKSS